MTPLARQLRWYIAIRVVAIVSVLLPFGLFQLWMLPVTPQSSEPGPCRAARAARENARHWEPPRPAPVPQAAVPSVGPPPELEVLPRNVVWLLGGATFGATLFYIALLSLLRRFRHRPGLHPVLRRPGADHRPRAWSTSWAERPARSRCST